MAVDKGGENATDVARREGSQPDVSDPKQPDLTTASPDAARAAFVASGYNKGGGLVAMVPRDVNGDPAPHLGANFEVYEPEHYTDAERDAAWNRAGEAQGAKNFDPKRHRPQIDEGDREEQLRKENAAIARANLRQGDLYEGKK